MRNSVLSSVRHITSSLQSPRISALRLGVAFDPFIDLQFSSENIGSCTDFSQFHLDITLRSSNSRSKSPSHQTAKLQELGFVSDINSLLALNNPIFQAPATQHSDPL